ncbi:unnamed protein product [Ectocarpus sp. CCAP 1310/34]|nr:unnamed protein product [Ectocarpus sp. CCAP 1310/34]
MFKLPLNEKVVDGAFCDINSESQRAELIRKCNLIIFDELPMTHRYCIKALERTLRDIRRSEALYVEASFISSELWPKTKLMRLAMSQRDEEDPAYASFVRSIGENIHPTTTFSDGAKRVPLSNTHDTSTTDHFSLQYTTDFNDLINFVYSDIHEDARHLNDHAPLATTNTSIDSCNDAISSRRQGDNVTFHSSDTLIKDHNNPASPTAFCSTEHLNNIDIPGVPPRQLKIKSDALAMLIRNLNFSEGLVNGQKVVIRGVSPNSRVVRVELLSDHSIVLIRRISFHAQYML